MKPLEEHEPPGWRDLCAKLQAAKDPKEFQAIVEQINRLLAAHEKEHPETLDDKPLQPAAKKSKRAKVS